MLYWVCEASAGQETGDKRQETRDKRQETRDKRQETRDKRQETRDRNVLVAELDALRYRQFEHGGAICRVPHYRDGLLSGLPERRLWGRQDMIG
jgi:hypothetical protein